MKYTLSIFLLFILFQFQCFAQDTICISKTGIKGKDRSQMDSYEIIKLDCSNTKRATITNYFKNGQLKSTIDVVNERSIKAGEYKTGLQSLVMYNDIRWLFDGEYKEWYESGELYKKIGFRKGGNCQEALYYWANGQIKRKEIYDDQSWSLISGECFDQDGKQISFYPVYTEPEFKKGNYSSLSQFYYNNIRYPENAIKRKLASKIAVFIEFDNTGKFVDAFVRHPFDQDLDSAAIALAKTVEQLNKPATVDGSPISQQQMFVLSYNLPEFAREMIEKATGMDSIYVDKSGCQISNPKKAIFVLLFKPVIDSKDELFYKILDKNRRLVSITRFSKLSFFKAFQLFFKYPFQNTLMTTRTVIDTCLKLSNEIKESIDSNSLSISITPKNQ